MDKEVLKRQLTERFQQSLESTLKAVDEAPDGQSGQRGHSDIQN